MENLSSFQALICRKEGKRKYHLVDAPLKIKYNDIEVYHLRRLQERKSSPSILKYLYKS